ncbi:MAG: hypothetical protein R6U31_01575 [bacterium]
MKRILTALLFIPLILLSREIALYEMDDWNAAIYHPVDYEVMPIKQGVIFTKDNISFSLLTNVSDRSARSHLVSFEKRTDIINELDSLDIPMDSTILDSFNIDNGYRGYYQIYSENHLIHESILSMKRDSIVYFIISRFDGNVPPEEVDIVNQCISRFRVMDDDE